MNRCFATVFMLAAFVLSTFDTSEALAAKAKNKKGGLQISGKIVNAIPGKENNTGTLTISGSAKGKKGDAKPEPKDFVFRIDKSTKIEKAAAKGASPDPGTFGDLQVGKTVTIRARLGVVDVADTVTIAAMKKKKK